MKDNKDNSATKTDTSPEKTPENKS
jgi:hypothetical protein